MACSRRCLLRWSGRAHLPVRPMLEKLLTEQQNPASASIDTVSTEEALRIINAEDQRVAGAVEREIPAIARAVDAIVAAIGKGGRLFYLGRWYQRAAGGARRVGVPADVQRARGDGAGHHGRGRGGVEPGHRGHGGRSGNGVPRPAGARLHRKRRAGRNHGQRADALRAGRGGRSEGAGRGDGRHLLLSRFGAVEGGGHCHRPAGRAGNRGRIDAHEVGNRTETGPQHALYRYVHPVGICLRQPDGKCPAQERQARGSSEADRGPGLRRVL